MIKSRAFWYIIKHMTNRKKLIIFIPIFAIIIGFAGWYIYRDYVQHRVFDNSAENGSLLFPESAGGDVSTPNLEEIKKQMPNLNREIVFTGNFSEEQKNRATAEIKMITASLRADYDKLEDWLTLGIWRKTIGDYEGAAEAWKFANIIRPKDPVAFHNLGDLYSQYLPDYPKAEKYYLTAIEKDTGHNSFFSIKLYEFYRYYYKKLDLAEKTLLDAIKVNPGDEQLKAILADFRKETGKK